MKRKKVKKYAYKGLGFDVVIMQAPFVKMSGKWVLDLDMNLLQKIVLMKLAWKAQPFIGNEIAFIRKYFEMTSSQLSKILGVTHPAVLKWEKSGNDFAKISPTADSYIRLFILDKIGKSSREFRDFFRKINIPLLTEQRKSVPKPVSVDVDEECFG